VEGREGGWWVEGCCCAVLGEGDGGGDAALVGGKDGVEVLGSER